MAREVSLRIAMNGAGASDGCEPEPEQTYVFRQRWVPFAHQLCGCDALAWYRCVCAVAVMAGVSNRRYALPMPRRRRSGLTAARRRSRPAWSEASRLRSSGCPQCRSRRRSQHRRTRPRWRSLAASPRCQAGVPGDAADTMAAAVQLSPTGQFLGHTGIMFSVKPRHADKHRS